MVVYKPQTEHKYNQNQMSLLGFKNQAKNR